MLGCCQFTPAFSRRAFFFLVLALSCAGLCVRAQPGYRPQAEISQGGRPSQAEGKLILDQFRGLGFPGSYYLEFQLRVMPRRGDERLFTGRMWGTANERGPVTRVALVTPDGEHRLLVQDGSGPGVWQRKARDMTVEPLGIADLFTPLAGTDLTAFDLQRPYLGWTDFVYEGLTRVRGRPTYKFLLYPPTDFIAKYPALTGVRVYLDTQQKAMVQSEQIGKDGGVRRSMSLQELKKIGEQWMLKSIDLKDETTRDKTRFTVTGIALNQDFIGDMFSPASLQEDVQSPPAGRITRIDP